jgi:hypothetical protein
VLKIKNLNIEAMRKILLFIIATMLTHIAWCQIESATYDASSGVLTISGSGFSNPYDAYPDSITIKGLGATSYTLTSATPLGTVSPSSATLIVSGIDRAYINALIDQNGRTASDGVYYLFDVADGWNGPSSTAETNDTITVSNYSPPSISSAVYDASTGNLVVSGLMMASNIGANDDIDPSKLTITGEASGTVTLNSTSGVEVTSHDEFTITLTDPDRSSVENVLNINGTVSNDGTTYDIDGAEDWNAPSNGTDLDNGANGITVSNVPLLVNATVTDNEICEGESVTLSANPSGGDGSSGYSFSWTSSPAGFISSDENPVVSPTVTTTYTVEVSGGGTETSQVTVTVHPKPTLTSDLTPDNICSGSNFIYSPTSDENVSSFNWSRSTIVGIDEGANSGSGVVVEILTNSTNAAIPVEYTYDMTTIHTCTNSQSVTVDVNPPADMDPVGDIEVCSGASVSEIVFSTQSTGGTPTYNWTNSNTSIGLAAASGTGNIPAFTATAGPEPEIATISVTPIYTIGGKSCEGSAEVFTILVNPNGQVNAIGDQVLCEDDNTTYINFTTVNTLGTTTFDWTNTQTGIGLGASSSDDIASFTATNVGTSPLVGTIEVTPTYTYSGLSCPGTPEQFTITVNPTAQIDAIGDQKLCLGESTTVITFNTANTGGTTTYNWVNNNTNIGLAASGSGNSFGSFTPTLPGNSPELATITVTPTFENGGHSCTGPPEVFTILVNPDGQVNSLADQVLCENDNTTYINFTTVNTFGITAFDWTNTETGIGLIASGSDDIASFTAANGSTSPLLATIEVTPTYTYGGHSCIGSSEQLSITVNPTAQMDAIGDQQICLGENTTAITFNTANTGGTTTYNWVNDNTNIGLAASGSGNSLASFTPTLPGNSPELATITVTPTFENGGQSCTGSPEVFTILVNPDGQVNSLTDQVLCENENTTYINFTTANTLGTTTFDWTNTQTGIGLLASGTDDIASFTAANGGTSPLLATIEVTPTYTYGGHSCIGSSEQLSITVNPTAQMDAIGDQKLCLGDNTTAITFTTANTGGTTTYNWVNDNTNIGLAASGSGNSFASFTPTLPGNSPELATITVTPTFENGGQSCTGSPEVFTILVNPDGQVNSLADQVLCENENTTYINFTTANTLGTTTFDWTNTQTGIGLIASGTDDIASFTAANASTSPLLATIEVTPTYTYGGHSCIGPSEQVSITVNPTAQVSSIGDQQLCLGESTTSINFSTANTGGITTYSWINDNTNIGLAASGSGTNIASFTPMLSGNSPELATITVTPTFENGGESCEGPPEVFTILVNPNGQVSPLGDQVLCEGEQTAYVNFVTTNSGGTTVFDWINDNASIGLAASGSDDIPSFALLNGGDSPVVATVEVTPEFSYNGKVCVGSSEQFTITSNPTAQINSISDKVFCDGETTGGIIFSTSNSGGITSYSWTNTNTAIGLAASGLGNIPTFNAQNNGSFPITATIMVTPSFANGGEVCEGTTESFTITVNPTAQVNSISDISVCSGQRISDISFSTTNVLGSTSYSWTNSTGAIGLALSGVGEISSFIGNNTTQTQIVSTVVVSPTYTYSGKTCSGTSKNFQITVNPLPEVSFTMPQIVYSSDALSDTISGAIPYGGTFFGSGIIAIDSTFHPTSAGVGDHLISYTADNLYGCRDTVSTLVRVVPPGGTISGLEPYYCDYAKVDTIRGIPDTGGTLDSANCGFTPVEGLIILNDSIAVIDPSVMSGINIEIKFTYFNGAYFDVIATTTIHEVMGTAGFIGLDGGYCVDGDAVTLSGSPPGGIFFGEGISGNQFDPEVADIGIHQISYTYTLSSTTCKDTVVQNTEVFALPKVFFRADSLYCSNINPVQFIGKPPTGFFTGPNLSGADTVLFSPNSSIVGPNNISYTYTDENGCRNTYDRVVRVTQVATVGMQAINDNYCVNGDSVELKGEVLGVFEGVGDFSGVGVNNNTVDDGIGYFRPDLAGAGGPYEVVFTYTDDNGCVSAFSKNLIVRDLPSVSINDLDALYCVNSPSSSIRGVPQSSAGSFFYSGNQLDLNDLNDGTASFTPSEITSSDTVTYTYTDGYGCTNSYWQELEVVALPEVSFESDTLFCPNGSSVEIVGVPSGGFFTGPNITGTDTAMFAPSESIIGTHDITYTYTDGNSCTNSFTREIEVQELPIVAIVNLLDYYCVNGDSSLLTATVNGIVTSDGSFTGQGIFDEFSNDGEAYFKPDIAGVGGPYEVQYTYESLNNCIATASDFVIVRELPTVSISSPSNMFCVNGDVTTITGIPQSSNGSFSYSGVISNLIDLGNGTAEFYPNNVINNGVITYTYEDQYGCVNSYDEIVEVSALPNVYFDSDSVFCPNGSSVQIIGQPAGGFFSGPNITGSDIATFAPSESIIGTHDITYTYTDENSCTNSFTREIEVQELPTVGIINLMDYYCVNGDSALLTATANGIITSDGAFTGQGIFDEFPDDGKAYFIPSEAGVGGPYEIHYAFESMNNCLATTSSYVLVRDLPTVSISSPSNLFCENGDVTTITGIPQSNNGSFSYSGVVSNLINLGNGIAEFYPNNVTDNGVITYTYEDQYGCVNSFDEVVKVSALPNIDFELSTFCIGDTINFINQTTSAETIVSWIWDFGDPFSGNNSSNEENPSHFYSSSGDKAITLTANTIDGCSDYWTYDVELGGAPFVSFRWKNECFNDRPIAFVNESDDLTDVYWSFGDGTSSNYPSPNHAYGNSGSYNVSMQVRNQFGCTSEISKTITVRPYINQYPYFADFEGVNAGWTIDIKSSNSSWELGNPNGTIINSAFSGNNSWVTGLINSYQNNEKSSVESPCYDFTNTERPMIKMNVWSATQSNADGALLQAKYDGVTDWFNIGDLNDVINWYNGVGLSGNPGGSPNVGSYGWTGIEDQWKEARHSMDFLKGKKNVRFRIAFGSDASGTSDGFAFDDFWIGERSKKVLAESFTNSSDNQSALVNPGFNELMLFNASDIVDIQYHTGFPGADPFNQDNPADVAARSAYYGLSDVPWTIFDGNVYSGSTSGAIDNYMLVEEQSLMDPVFAIDLETITGGGQITLNVNVTSNENLSGKNLTMHAIVIESEVNSVTGTNGETQFFSVVRKMLPNAGGTILNSNWTANQTQSYTLDWTYTNIIDPEKVNAVVFIQDEDTRMVYQVATDDTAASFNSLPKVVLEFGQDPFMLYPNPSRGMVNVLFEQPIIQGSWMEVYDMTGALVASEQLQNGTNSSELNLEHLRQGIYIIRIMNQDGTLGSKRFIKQ